MSEIFDPTLLDRIVPPGSGTWNILNNLAALKTTLGETEGEERLQIILRPHEEAHFSPKRDHAVMQQRERLDRALLALTLLEIGCETGQIAESVVRETAPVSFGTLTLSEAFFHYCDVYLFFGVRLLAGRLYAPAWWRPGTAPKLERIKNQRSFPLAVPPKIGTAMLDSPCSRLIDKLLQRINSRGLRFLDGFTSGADEPANYELWLRGLLLEIDENVTARFRDITSSLVDFAITRTAFYKSLQPEEVLFHDTTPTNKRQPISRGWIASNPIIARLALADIYYLARLLRAEISTAGHVTYAKSSWLHLLRFHLVLHDQMDQADRLVEAEDVLRAVFGFACDLVQNATELTDERESRFFRPENYSTPPESNRRWREVFDEEMKEIKRQRAVRSYQVVPPIDPSATPRSAGQQIEDLSLGWSQALVSSDQPCHRVGVAFSGGGIRSATFNLGILQGLQEFDLLRQADYLSSVSGGGYTHSWLAGNVLRTRNWLAIDTSWDESIEHLRSYSNYLAPLKGILSADTWSMGVSWLRNTFLIQLTGFTWLLALLLAGHIALKLFFVAVKAYPVASWHTAFPNFSLRYGIPCDALALSLLGTLVTLTLLYNFTSDRTQTGKNSPQTRLVRRLAVLPTSIAAYIIAAVIWSVAANSQDLATHVHYSYLLVHAWHKFPLMLGFAFISLLLVGSAALIPKVPCDWMTTIGGISRAFGISALCVLVLYLDLCAILFLFLKEWVGDQLRFLPYAFVYGPALVLIAFTVSVVLMIGLSGRFTVESQREWWTRFGSWILIYGISAMLWSAFAVFGPRLTQLLLGLHHWAIPTATIVGWVGTVLSGLFAGKSNKTAGDGSSTKSPALEYLARASGLLFICGSIVIAATVLYQFLRNFIPKEFPPSNYWGSLQSIPVSAILFTSVVVIACGLLFSWLFELNIFGINQFYRNRLVRCYLGATRWTPGIRKPHPFTGFDFNDDTLLMDLRQGFRGPFPIFNCALNLGGSADLALNTRHSASFTLTPLRCGSDRPKVGYAPTGSTLENGSQRCFADGVMLGQAVSISGAAASPNMGYNTSPLVAFLLTMFNVRLGWWFPNPGQARWYSRGLNFSLYYLTRELFGIADEHRQYLNISDGGHFENLGIYELIRRRCEVIIASDAECDEQLQFGGLGNVIRICETDFGAVIDIDVKSIRQQKDGVSLAHCAVGTIKYSNGDLGYLIYLKASISGDEDVSIAQYRSSHPSFPHESTANQFFTEDQFESYRKLGQHVVRQSLRGTRPGEHPLAVAQRLFDVLVPSGCSSEAFLKHTKELDRIWNACRKSPVLHPFIDELMSVQPAIAQQSPVQPPFGPGSQHQRSEEFCMGLELLQLMENVFMDLRLDDFWEHPDNRGWAILFMRWARSPRFRSIWQQAKRTYGIRFEYFCSARLGLARDNPIARV